MTRLTAIAAIVAAAGCVSSTSAPALQAEDVARAFQRTCIAAAAEGRPLNRAFTGAEGFTRTQRPSPGPGAFVYESGNILGIGQRHPFVEAPRGVSCSVRADLSERESLFPALESVLAGISVAAKMGPNGQAEAWTITLPNQFRGEVRASLLGDGRGSINQVPGNVGVMLFEVSG